MKNKKVNDIILIAALIIALVMGFIFLSPKIKGNVAVITVDGEEVARYSLTKDFETDIVSSGVNHIIIKGSKISVSSANCKNQVCVNKGEISKVGEAIVCLPHSLIIEIVSEGNYEAE